MSAFDELMDVRGGVAPRDAEIISGDPAYASTFPMEETAAAVLAAIGVAVSDIWEMKTGRRQTVCVDMRHAAAAIDDAEHLYLQQDDGGFAPFGDSPLAARAYDLIRPYPTRDGRWFLPHIGIRHLKERVFSVLQCEDTREGMSRAIAGWDAEDLDAAIAGAGACGGIVRAQDEWRAHPQGQALAAQAVVEIEKIADSDPEPFPQDGPPLAGLKVLDLTRVLAGPVAARSLAEQGAEVLMVAARHLPQFKKFVIDLSPGKRSCFLDLNRDAEAERLRDLVREADVFSQGYRPGVLEARGFGPEALAALRPGLIYTSINCYGQQGPFADRAGWEQVAQTVSGICHANAEEPELLPVPVCDYTTGYLGVYGTLLALARRAREGGSYHVKVSLCQTAMFLTDQPRRADPTAARPLSAEEVAPLQVESETSYGRIRQLGPVIRYGQTQGRWNRPSPALGGDEAVWLS